MRRWPKAILLLVGIGLPWPAVAANLFPLATEEARPLRHGETELFLGFAYLDDDRFPPFTPKGALASHELYSLPRFGFRIGAGGWAEIQASYELLLMDEELSSGRKDTHYGSGDARLFTKVQLLDRHTWRPDLAVRFGTKLPNANRENRLGTDDTDFFIEALASRAFGPVQAHANLGIALLGNSGPAVEGAQTWDAGGQDDLFTWLVAATGEPQTAWELRPLVEIGGQAGSRFYNDRTTLRLGTQRAFGAIEVYGGMSVGLAGGAEDFGLMTGLVYRFRPNRWQGDGD